MLGDSSSDLSRFLTKPRVRVGFPFRDSRRTLTCSILWLVWDYIIKTLIGSLKQNRQFWHFKLSQWASWYCNFLTNQIARTAGIWRQFPLSVFLYLLCQYNVSPQLDFCTRQILSKPHEMHSRIFRRINWSHDVTHKPSENLTRRTTVRQDQTPWPLRAAVAVVYDERLLSV